MALRSVGVKLVAEVRDYITGMKESSKVTDDFASDLAKAAKAGDETAVATEVFGRTAKTAAQHVDKLDREIESVEKELRKLAVAYAEAGTAAERADLDGAFSRTNRELSELKKNRNVLRDLIPGEPEVKKFNTNLFEGFSDGLMALRGPAVAALLPLLGGVASAAIIGGTAGVGIAGGLLLASKDPRVQAAGKALGENLLGELKKDADVFVEPVLKNIGKIEVAFHGMNGQIQRIFQNSSKFVDPLVNGVLDGVHGLVDGIDKTVAKAGPVVDAVGRSFATLGTSAGKSLSIIAGGSSNAARALDDLSGNAGDLVVGIGGVVRAFTELYGILNYLPDKGVAAWERWKFGVDEATAKTRVASTIAGTFASVQEKVATTTLSAGEAAGKAGMQMQTYADKMDEASAKGRGLYDSQTDVAQAAADVTKAVKENGRTLDINTQKGRDNRKVLSDLAGKLQANYDAYVKVNGEGAGSQKVAENNRAAFLRLAGQFDKTKGRAEALATELGLIPANKPLNFYANTHDAEARIAALKGHIGGVKGKTVYVHVSVTGLERLDEAGHRIGGYKAEGGPVKAGVPYVVGEKRAEVFVPDQNGTIVPSVSSYMNRSGARAMPSGFGPQKVIVETRNIVEYAGSPDVFGQAILNMLRVRPGIRQTMAKTLGVAA